MIIIETYIVAYWTTANRQLIGEPLAPRREVKENKYKVLVVT